MMQKKNSLQPSYGVVLSFLLPSFIGFFIFILLPVIGTFFLSFTKYSGGFKIEFVGLKNYFIILQSPTFLQSLWVTFTFTVLYVIIQTSIALFVAVILANPLVHLRRFFRSVFFMPCLLSTVALSLGFVVILNPSKGPLNAMLAFLNLPKSKWLAGENTALVTLVLIMTWQNFGYYMVIFLAGLTTINPSLYDCADIEGASSTRKFFGITLPMLSSTMFFVLILSIIRGFQVFDLVYAMTGGRGGGGPDGATNVLVFDINQRGFSQFKMGQASAESFLLLLIVLFITIIQYRQKKKWVNYDVV